MKQNKVFILDTTLRDGAQSAGTQFSLHDKLGIVMLLDNLGIDYIEAGTPASNPKDAEFFRQVKRTTLEHAKVVAFGLTRKKDKTCEEDTALQALIDADTETVTIVGKTSAYQVEQVLGTDRAQNLSMIRDTIKYLCEKGKEVFFDAEHFFDGYGQDSAYAMECLKAAADAGAAALVLCDTNGGVTPKRAAEVAREVVKAFPGIRIGTHFHNDIGCAVAASLAAVDAGAMDVQGTFLGFGERCGNTNLSTLIPTLALKEGYDAARRDRLPLFTRTAHHIADICNMLLPTFAPYVGAGAFSHKGGMHIDGVMKDSGTFEHVDPAAVGNERRLLLSEMSGRSAVAEKLRAMDEALVTPENVQRVLARLKDKEYGGYSYEAALASFELMALRELEQLPHFFTLLDYKIIGERSLEAGRRSSVAVVKIQVGDDTELYAAEGDGPVHALDLSLRGALARFYPTLSRAHLVDYKVRVIEPENATAAKVRVLIDTTDGERRWTTVGVSADIIDASFKAVTDSIVHMLNREKAAL